MNVLEDSQTSHPVVIAHNLDVCLGPLWVYWGLTCNPLKANILAGGPNFAQWLLQLITMTNYCHCIIKSIVIIFIIRKNRIVTSVMFIMCYHSVHYIPFWRSPPTFTCKVVLPVCIFQLRHVCWRTRCDALRCTSNPADGRQRKVGKDGEGWLKVVPHWKSTIEQWSKPWLVRLYRGLYYPSI